MRLAITVNFEKIREYSAQAFAYFGVSKEDAFTIADNLVQAELRGIKSHGLIQVKRYVNLFENGKINPKPAVKTLRESASTLALDADYGPGSVVGKYAMARTIEKAREMGIASTTVTNATHFGMAAYYAMDALKENMIGITFCNSPTVVAPHGGYSRMLGTNPICVAVPAAAKLPIVYDAATSEAPYNKIFFALTEGRKIPHGWALDNQGRSTDDPGEAMNGSLVTFGGYKGFGLSVLVHIFSGILSGATVNKDENGRISEDSEEVGFYFSAIDIEKFFPAEDFKQAVDLMIDRLKSSKPIDEATPIYMPGELEVLRKENSIKNGIEILDGVHKDLAEVGEKLGLALKLEDCVF